MLMRFSPSVLALLAEPRLCKAPFFTAVEKGCGLSRLDRLLIRRLETPSVGVWGDSFGS